MALAAVLGVFVCAGPAGAARVRAVNFEEMTRRAAVIFSGRAVAVEIAVDPVVGRETTRVTFEVDRVAKGDVGRTYSLRLPGANDAPGRWSVTGLPRFAPGEEVLVFLYGKSALGLSSPVGLGQGVFRVGVDKEGRRTARSDGDGANLWRGLSNEAASRLDTVTPRWREGKPVGPDVLLDMAQALETGP